MKDGKKSYKAKVLLINPPLIDFKVTRNIYYPIGLLSIATLLVKNNIKAELLDANLLATNMKVTEDALATYIITVCFDKIRNLNPCVIGIGGLFSGSFVAVKTIARLIKQNFPQIPIVIGGIHPTMFYREILSTYKFIDYVIIGEGEYSFLELVLHLMDRRSVNNVGRLAYRNGNENENEVSANPTTNFIDNLDDLPDIDYNIVDTKDYKEDTSDWYSPKKLNIGFPFPILLSRSCPNQCNFCSMWMVHGKKIRFRSPERVVDEISRLYYTYGMRQIDFMDDNLTFSKERILKICEGIVERNLNIQFATPNGVSIKTLDKEIIDAMVEAGLFRVGLAIESGSEYIRNTVMRKGLKTEKIYEVVELAAKHKHLFLNGYFMIGMPQETHETLEDTYTMIKALPLDMYGISFATPYPGTELYYYCLKHNLISHKGMLDDVNLQSIRDTPHFKPHALEEQDLIDFRKKCLRELDERRKNVPPNYPIRYAELHKCNLVYSKDGEKSIVM